MQQSMGKRFRERVTDAPPLVVCGAVNAYSALLLERSGGQAVYLSGAGVANASYGIPDLGMTNLSEVLEDIRRITAVTTLPLLVDVDTGWGHVFNIARTVKSMERASVAAIHIEDQAVAKRCGHRPNKTIVSAEEMGDRIKAAVDARVDPNFVIMARTDAYAQSGLSAAIDRACHYIEMGADMIFPEALTTLADYQAFAAGVGVPILANITEFGRTPLFTQDELAQAGVQIILYPLSAFRAMSKAATTVYDAILNTGTQKDVIDVMQTRDDLYDVLGYRDFEKTLDQFKENEDVK